MATKIVSIKSDSDSSTSYDVELRNGRAVACSCPAAQRGLDCKHLWRAESRPHLVRAMNALIAQGYSKRALVARLEQKMADAQQVRGPKKKWAANQAIADVIRAGLPDDPQADQLLSSPLLHHGKKY